MTLRRKYYRKLLNWKKTSEGGSALFIHGARCVGKSFLCRQFGEREYRSVVLIDFEDVSQKVAGVFEEESHDLDMFFKKLSALHRVRLFDRESLIVLDEAWRFPPARRMMKSLVADGRYDYVETASFLSKTENGVGVNMPLEEEYGEECLEMFPLDFEEFLWAVGDRSIVPSFRTCLEKNKPLGQELHRRAMNYFRQYLLVGGMPQAVMEYVKEKDFAAVDGVKRRILELYRRDMVTYAGKCKSKVIAIYDSIPGQLSRKRKKYKVTALDRNARLRNYEDAFMWLEGAMIVNPCFNVAGTGAGLALNGDYGSVKLYMADTGLLVTHAFDDGRYSDNGLYCSILLNKLNVNEGMLMENAVAQILRRKGRRLYFYSKSDIDNYMNRMEIDFLVGRKNKICPVEVQPTTYKAQTSLDKFMTRFAPHLGKPYVLYPKDVMKKEGVIHLPLCMAMFL